MLMKAVEARKKAEVVHIHIRKCRNTLNKRSPNHYSLDGFLLSPLSLHSFLPFNFFYTLTKSKDSGPQALFLSTHSLNSNTAQQIQVNLLVCFLMRAHTLRP